jgi:Xaa-Pro aminopeptidase
MIKEIIPKKEYAARRSRLVKSLKGAIGLIHSGNLGNSLHETYRPNPNFLYLTGLSNEPGALLFLDSSNQVESKQVQLFLKPRDPEIEVWDGYRSGINQELRQATGIETIFRIGSLDRYLTPAAVRCKRLACLQTFSGCSQPVSSDFALFKKVAERIPGVVIEDHSQTLAKMRSRKSSHEIKVIRKAIEITSRGFSRVLEQLAPGMNEFDVQETLEHAYKIHGARGVGYNTIAGSGLNSTVLHYQANDAVLQPEELICIDSGAAFQGYCADVTRTFPVSGKFTKRQKEIYEIVLEAELAAIRKVRPGVTFAQLDQAARGVICKAGFADAFMHGIGHHLGLEVHDITPDEPLKEGAVITIEPGVYLPDEKIGIRIEDDILVTRTGSKNLSEKIPKTVLKIERIMKQHRHR